MSTTNSTEASPSPSPINTNNAPKYGTLVPNRIFVGGISASTTESELHALFSNYGNVKATKIISDRAGVSKGYGFVTFESEEEAKRIQKEADNIVLKDRKLNIAPAIKKQQPFTRMFGISSVFNEPSQCEMPETLLVDPAQVVPNGTLMYHNGIPYTYQNGMAFFTSPENNYPFPQPQTTYPMIYPQPMYVPQQQYPYQTPAQPQWANGQWRWTSPVNYGQNPNLNAVPYMYPHTTATSASGTLPALHAGDIFQYSQPAMQTSIRQPAAADMTDIPIVEATPTEIHPHPKQKELSIMEQHRQVIPLNSYQATVADVPCPIDFHVLPLEQGTKTFKNSISPRKACITNSSSRIQQQQHRQKYMTKHINGMHFLTFSASDKAEDFLHTTDNDVHASTGAINSVESGNSSIIESARKLQALNL